MAIPVHYAWRNLYTRKLTSVLTAGGMALVAFVFTAVLMLAEGLEQTLKDTGSPENAIILRGAAETEVSSVIDRHDADIIRVQSEVESDANGDPIAARESLVLVTLPKGAADKPTNVTVRGTDRYSRMLRPQVKLIQGREIKPGSRELVVGRNISERITGASIGGVLHFAMSDWTVVGIMDAGKTAFDSEIWADGDQLMAAFRRNAYSVVVARVPGSSLFSEFKKNLERDPRLSVQIKRETAFYREQSEIMAKFIRILGIAMTSFFSMGAILGAMVTMYSAVANRTREIGTMRALGFQRNSIMSAFLMESLLLGLIGGLLGIAGSSSLQFITIATMNWQTFSELAFGFTLTKTIAAQTLFFSVIMGFLGGVLPAWRASQLKIVDALREN